MNRRYIKMFIALLLALCMVTTYAVFPGNGAVYAASKKVPVKSITLKYKNIKLNNGIYTLKKGKSLKLNAVISPKKVAGKANVVWKSSNQKIVSVTKQGKIKAKKAGKATVIATVKGTKKKAKVTIYVGTPVKKVTVSKGSVTLEQGQTYKIASKLNPKKPSVKGVKYSSNNKNIATVSSNGVISAVTPGTTTVLVKPKDLAGNTAKVTVTVLGKTPSPSPSTSPSPSPSTKYMVSSIELSRYECYIAPGKTVKVNAEVYPENATNKKLTWKSDDTSVATVDQDGLITAIDTGYTYITVAASDGSGIYEEIYVVVKNEYLSVYGMETGISYEDGDTIVMHEGMPTQLEVNAFEQDAEGLINISSEAGASLKIDEYDEYYYYYGDVYRSVVLTPSSEADNKTLTVSYGSFTKTFKLKVYKQFALNFESNGGEALASMTIFEDTKLRLPSPFREKYVFKGWYLESGLSTKIEDGSTLDYNASGYTLYADWEEEYLELIPSSNNIEAEDINIGLEGILNTNGVIDNITYTVFDSDENDVEKTSGTAIIGLDEWSIDTLGISPGTNRVIVNAVTTAGTEAQAEVILTYDRGEVEAEVSEDNVAGIGEEDALPFVNNRIDIFFEDDVTEDEADSIIREIGATQIGFLRTINMYQVELSQNYNNLDDLINFVKSVEEKYEAITLAEPEFIAQDADQITYNDPWNNADWDMANPSGANWWAEAIDSPGAWNYASKMQSVRVGVIDSGFDVDHAELSDNVRFTSNSRKNQNNKDGHGTWVAGIIAAEQNNGVGITGIAWMNNLYLFNRTPQLTNIASWRTDAFVISAMEEAVENGCKVVNMSFGKSDKLKDHNSSYSDSEVNSWGRKTSASIGKLLEKGFDFNVVQSAGNGAPIEAGSSSKCGVDAVNNGFICSITNGNCYSSSKVSKDDIMNRLFVVGGAYIDDNGSYTMTQYSNGGGTVNIAAPGENIYSLNVDGYITAGGTSASAPMVAAVASLVWSINPEFSGDEVQRIVLDSCEHVVKDNTSSPNATGSKKLVNARLAVESALGRGGKVKGYFSDATTGERVAASYAIHKGSASGSVISNEASNTDGSFEISGLSAGTYVLEITSANYVNTYANIIVPVRGVNDIGAISLTNEIDPNAYRIILNWGSIPNDLDSHIRGIDRNNNDSHVYYSNMYATNLNLDRDDTDRYGPETITVSNLGSFTELKYAIHNYSDRYCSTEDEEAMNLAKSGATVSVFKGNTLLQTFTVPKNKKGTVWNVFSLNRNGTIRPINSMGFDSSPEDVLSASF